METTMLRSLVVLFTFCCGATELSAQIGWSVIDASIADGGPDHRREALAAIGTIGAPDPEAVRRAESALQDKNSTVRQTAALVLGELKAVSSIPSLKEQLQGGGEVGFAAAKALSALGDASGRDFLVSVLAGERKDTQPGIVKNAIHKADHDLKHPQGLIFTGADAATGAMFGPVSIVLPVLKDTVELKGKGAPGRAAAAAYLAEDPDPDAIPLLEWGLGDENHLVRIEAAKALGQRGNRDSIAKLRPLLADPHNFVRDMAAAAVIRIESRNGAAGPPADGVPQVPAKTNKTGLN